MKSRDDAARMPRGRDMGDPGRDRVKGEPIRCEGTWSSQGAGAVSRRAGSLDGRSLIVVRPLSRQCEVGPSLGLTLTPPLSSCARLVCVFSPHCEPESSHSPSGDPALTPDCRYCLSLLDVPVLVRLGPRTLCLWRDPEGLSVLLSVLSVLSVLSPLPLSSLSSLFSLRLNDTVV